MSYKDLYTYCQGLTPKVDRNVLRDQVLDLTKRGPLRTVRSTLDTNVCRGFYLSLRNTEHRFVQQNGTNLIVLARGLNYCWERFVFVKELMHMFDDPPQMADTGEVFEQMLSELTASGADPSDATRSEFDCFWMALGTLCPEELRQEFEKEREAGRLDDYAIALQLRIPQGYVQRYFEARYRRNLDRILGE